MVSKKSCTFANQKDVYPKFIIALHPSFPDCQPPFLFDDEHRSILYDFFIWAFLYTSADHSLQSYVGRALQGFTSSALLHNTKFEPFDLLPLKGDPSKIFVAPSNP